MISAAFSLAFIGPGGPEFLVVMLVLLLLFGSKDAPRIFRKINEMINQLRNTADGFKREIMYSDMDHKYSGLSTDDYDYTTDYPDEYDNDTYHVPDAPEPEKEPETEEEPEPGEATKEEGGDAEKA